LPPELAARLLPPGLKKKAEDGLVELASRIPKDLAENEHTIYKLLSTDTPVHIDALAEASALPLPELLSVLLSLEMRDLIRQLPGKCFVRKF
jgi:DNA processing protein